MLNRGTQGGATLVETLVALVAGLIVTGAMLAMMANTLRNGTRTIEMSRLQQEMRTAMQMLTRDVRRAAYNAEAIKCFSNHDCATDGSFPNGLTGDIELNDGNDCFLFEMDRDHDGDPTDDAPGGFRLRTLEGVGRIQMWTGAGDTTCGSSNTAWIDVTDPDVVDVDEFMACLEIDSDDEECSGVLEDGSDDPNMPASLSYQELIDDDGAGNLTWLKVRKLQVRITAKLRDDPVIEKTLVDRIRIRNDVVL